METPPPTFTSTLTRKGQVTIPAHIRRLLGVATGDKVVFLVSQGEVRIAPATAVVAGTTGMLKSDQPALALVEEHAAFEEALAEEAQGRDQ